MRLSAWIAIITLAVQFLLPWVAEFGRTTSSERRPACSRLLMFWRPLGSCACNAADFQILLVSYFFWPHGLFFSPLMLLDLKLGTFTWRSYLSGGCKKKNNQINKMLFCKNAFLSELIKDNNAEGQLMPSDVLHYMSQVVIPDLYCQL